MRAYRVVREFEAALCEYTGAQYAVTTNSCTMALLLSLAWFNRIKQAEKPVVSMPSRTYCSVPMVAMLAGYRPLFHDYPWRGCYKLEPYPVWDSARRFTGDMHIPGQYMCVSFHASKILGDTQGGAILHDSDEADAWFRRARFDGRTEGVHPSEDNFTMIGWHCYMSPDVAARLLLKLESLPRYNPDLPNDKYPDLSTMEAFR